MVMGSGKTTTFKLTESGKKKYENLDMRAPFMNISAALFEAESPLTAQEVASKTGYSEDTVKGALVMMVKAKLVSFEKVNSSSPAKSFSFSSVLGRKGSGADGDEWSQN